MPLSTIFQLYRGS